MTVSSNNRDIFSAYRGEVEGREATSLHPKAAFSASHSRFNGCDDDHRLPYQRDVDRIVHSKAYARYVDKTQVMYLVDNDHITHRALHVQLVANFAKGIAEILRLNIPLVEAIALGHDVGHPPFGHEGEMYLSELSEEAGNRPFAHPWQSCRLFHLIEPLNLGLSVMDGFLCHDGGMSGTVIEPRFGKTWDDHFADLDSKMEDPERNILPGTLEGCLVKMADTMSYLGRDIEDAIMMGILTREQVPVTVLGTTNREILSALARDVINNSYGKNYIAMSQEVYDALRTLRRFNFEHIYIHPMIKLESERVKRGYRVVFQQLLSDYQAKGDQSVLWKEFLSSRSKTYLDETSPVQMVVDYIAGMTDSFFIRTLKHLVVPGRIELA
jgi:dGTPase